MCSVQRRPLRRRFPYLILLGFLVLSFFKAMAADLDTWILSTPVFGRNRLTAVTYGDGLWIAVGDGGTIGTSSDGTRWTRRQSNLTVDFGAVAFGGGAFVVAGTGGAIVRSTDGMTWTTVRQATPASSDQPSGLAYGNGVYVSVSFGATIAASSNGINWSERAFSLPGQRCVLRAVTFAAGRFVIVGGIGSDSSVVPLIITSTDGVSWTRQAEVPLTGELTNILYANGEFVVNRSDFILTSPDALTWSQIPQGSERRPAGAIAFGDGIFLSTDNLSSANAVTWTQASAPSSEPGVFIPLALGFASGKFVGVGREGTVVVRRKGENWTPVAGSSSIRVAGAAYGNGRFVVTDIFNGSAMTTDGYHWESRSLIGGTGSRLAFGNGVFVVGTGDSVTASVATSPDGLEWSRQPIARPISSVIFARGMFVAWPSSLGDGMVMTSTDGKTWTSHSTGSAKNYLKLAEGNGRFVAVGTSGAVMTSPDANSWTEQAAFTTGTLAGVAYGAGKFVAVDGGTPRLWSSADGMQWTSQTIAPPIGGFSGRGFADIIFAAGRFVTAVGTDIVTSADGVTWTVMPRVLRFSETSQPRIFFAYGNGQFWAAESNGEVFRVPAEGTDIFVSVANTDVIVASGQGATLTATASGSNLSYQWYRGASGDVSSPIAGATSASFATGPLTQSQRFWVRASNALGTADGPTVIVQTAVAPRVVAEAREHEILTGDTIRLSNQVTGIPWPAIQWYRGRRGDVSRPVAGAVGSALSFTGGTTAERFWARASSIAGVDDSEEFHVVPWQQLDSRPIITRSKRFGETLVSVVENSVHVSLDNGITWTKTASISGAALHDIEQGAGLYVAVGEHVFLSSPDLRTWTERNLEGVNAQYPGAACIARGRGLFVAVGGPLSYLSANGVDWTPLLLPNGVTFYEVLFDGARFVAAGSIYRSDDPQRNRVGVIFTSTDGRVWTRRAQDVLTESVDNASTTLERIFFGGGKYLAISSPYRRLLVSTDAVNWSSVDLSGQPTGGLRSIGYVNGRFVISTTSEDYLVSNDGANWVGIAAPFSSITSTLSNAPTGELLASGGSRHSVFETNDALNWRLREGGAQEATLGMTNITYGLGRAIGKINSASSTLYTSRDGANWEVLMSAPRSPGDLPRGRGAYFNGCYVAGGQAGTIIRSVDGVRWTSVVVPNTSETFTRVVACGNRVFAFGGRGLATSSDGDGWISMPDPDHVYTGVAFGNGVFVSVGYGLNGAGNVWSISNDGVTWRRVASPPTTAQMNAIAFGNGRFLAASGRPALATSTDGETWSMTTPPTPPGSGGFEDVLFHGDRFFVTRADGIAFTTDGVSLQMGAMRLPLMQQLTEFNGRILCGNNLLRAVDENSVSISSVTDDQEVAMGGAAQLSVIATGSDLRYQWYEVGADALRAVAGATAASFSTPAVTSNRRYAVQVSGATGAVMSRAVLVSPAGPPMITRHPFSVEFLPGVSSLLRVEAESIRSLTYQWFVGETGDTRCPIYGAVAASYVVPRFSAAARFWVRVTNAHGSSDSAPALVTPWTAESPPSLSSFVSGQVAYGQGVFLATGNQVRTGSPAIPGVSTSPDGEQWTFFSTVRLGSVAFGNGRFVAVGGAPNDNVLHSAAEPATWNSSFTAAGSIRFAQIVFVGGRFLALSAGGAVATSTDGVNWRLSTLSSQALAGIAFGNGRFVIGADGGRVFASTDGEGWTAVSTPATRDIKGVAFAAGRFFAVDASGALFSSRDADGWQGEAVQTSDRWDVLPPGFSITTLGNRIVGSTAGASGGPFASLEGLRWGRSFNVPRIAEGAGVFLGLSVNMVARTAADAPLALLSPPRGQFVAAGGSLTLAATASGTSPVSFQWSKDGVPIPGATSSTLSLSNMSPATAGRYAVTVTNASGSVTSSDAVVSLASVSGTPTNPSRIANLSILAALAPGIPQFSLGVVVGGTGTSGNKPVLIRAAGPSLARFGLGNVLADPRITIRQGATIVASNDNWGGDAALSAAMAAVGAFPFASSDSRDAALAPSFAAGNYVIEIAGPSAGVGSVLAELYDATPEANFTAATPRLLNASVLKQLDGGFTVGFVISGGVEKPMLVRAVGPGLAALGVTGTLADPRFELFDGGGNRIDNNDNWEGSPVLESAFARVGAFGLSAASRDAALVAILRPGNYTARIGGTNGAGGLVLVEIYELP